MSPSHLAATSRARSRRIAIAAVAAVLSLFAPLLIAAPAMAADGALSVQKVVDGTESGRYAPGDEFTYTITVGCDDADCADAELLDPIPSAFEGFEVLALSSRPASQPATVSLQGCDRLVTTDCAVQAVFQQPLEGGAVGIRAGSTYQVMFTLKAPQDLAPTWASNGLPVVNTATATSDTAASASDTAEVVVSIESVVDVEVGKTWQPESQQFLPGASSTVSLTVQNTSNVAASALVLEDPAGAADASTLADDNPFRLVDFAGFGDVAAPDGADLVSVDAYVYNAGSWTWVAGPPVPLSQITLPADVAAGDVAGLRISFSSSGGATLTPGGAAGSVQLQVAQRATDRQTDETLVRGAAITNAASGTVTVPDLPPVTKTANAPYEIGGLTVAVDATKSIAPARIPAGGTATATIGARNSSNGPLSELVLTDADYFTEDITFAGFTAPFVYPEGTTGATVTWTFSDGSTQDTPAPIGVAPAAPAPPANAHLTGFAVTLIGAVAPGAVFNTSYTIGTDVDLVPSEDRSPVQLPNTVSVSGTNSAGSADDDATAPLAVFYPDIRLTIDKRISPAGAVSAGGDVVVQLPTSTVTDSAYVNPDRILVEDVWREGQASDFWNAFTPTAIAPTQVLSGSTLTVEALTPSGWATVTVFTPGDTTQVFSGEIATLNPAIDPATVTGLRFIFDRADGFAAGTTVSPNIVFEARSTLRDGGDPTATPNEPAETYENEATANGTGITGGREVQSDEVSDTAPASIIAFDGTGSLLASKTWNPTILSSQSGQVSTSRLGWGVTATGYDSVTLADPNGGEATPETTVFQAFDLVQINASQDSRWRWDTVSAIELYLNGSWQTIPAPGGTWMNGAGFTGYLLTPEQTAAATGVRITVTPNDAARASSTDPLRPRPGSGVVPSTNGQSRTFDLVWKLRNTVRVPNANGPWVTATHGYNDADPATIWNTVGVSGVRAGEPTGTVTARDDISLIDQPPAVVVDKTVDKTVVAIPQPGEVPPSEYPDITYTVTASNDSASRASYLRVTDPLACTDATVEDCVLDATDWDANPFADAEYDASNPFERADLTRLTFSIPAGAGVDASTSMVTLWKRASDGTLSTEVVSIAAATSLTATQLADVVGVSVLYQGTDPDTAGGTIATNAKLTMTFTTKVRVTARSTGAIATDPVIVHNDTIAQPFDPVLSPNATPYDTASADVRLVTGVLDVTASKTITPGSIIERDRAQDVSVRLQATSGDATVAAQEVTITDADDAFWDRFQLTAIAGVQLPSGADQVRVDVQAGSGDWVTGAVGPIAALPAGVSPADVTGIRFVFTRADGDIFSHTAPPAGWTAAATLTVRLLDAVRGTDDAIPFPSTVDNTLTTAAARTRDADIYPPVTADAADDIQLQTGSFALDVAKTPQGNVHTVEAGTTVPWTLTFANTGSGYLTVDQATDVLPTSLEADFSVPPVFSTSAGGLLSPDVTYSYDAVSRTIGFVWPEDGRRMRPGEVFTIELGIVLQPGLTQGQRATNQFTVTAAQPLTSCTNTSGNGQGVLTGLPANACGTSNYVEPIPGASLATVKGVRGEIDGDLVTGAVNTVTPNGPCVADAEGFYRSPCAANTVVGATDQWKLAAVNSGTVPYRSITLVEPLPTPGDRQLATGSPRGSSFRPVFDAAAGLDISAPDGSSIRWQVTTDANVCVGTGSSTTWTTDPTCAADSWTDADAFDGDWNAVSGLRVLVDFTTTATGFLAPGGGVTVKFQTVNAPATYDNPEQAPIGVPVADAFAWNQFGAQATLTNGATLRRAPVKAGVTLLTGSIEVHKAITGPAAAYAPDAFTADIVCTVAGATLDLGAAAEARMTTANGLTARVDGIPLGAECTVTEQGDDGDFGETTRSVTNPVLPVLQPGLAVPDAQIATLGNDYAYGTLSVTKAVETAATVGTFGPFTFEMACTTTLGADVELADADRQFTLAGGATHTVTTDTIPVGATCEITETDTDDAATVAFTGGAAVDNGDASATVIVGGESAVTATNRYDAGTLSVLKTVIGDGGSAYGTGPFAASVVCTYGGEVVFTQEELAIVPDEPTLVGTVFPAGTLCTIEEVLTGGANEHTDPPAVVIPGPTGDDALGAVTAVVTNDFRIGELLIRKERVGDGVAEFGTGPFQAQAVCTWEKNGDALTVPLADGGIVTLSEDGDFAARIDGIPVGAECVIIETEAGLATDVTLAPANGVVTVLDPADTEDVATVTITNRFDVGQLSIEKIADTESIAVDDVVRYTITVRNTGQIDASDITVTDLLPKGAEVVDTAPAGRVHDGVVDWTVENLPAKDSMQLTVDVRYAAAGEATNQATVSTPDGPWRPVIADHECEDGVGSSCAAVEVTTPPNPGGGGGGTDTPPVSGGDRGTATQNGSGSPLAQTGGPGGAALTLLALILLGGGALVTLAYRRRRS